MAFMMTRTHGNAFAPEKADGVLLEVDGNDGTDVTGMPFGWGRTFRIAAGHGTWFHIAIPSIAQLDASPLYIDQFYVFFTTEVRGRSFTTQVAEVDAWDGSARIFHFRPPEPYAGDFSNPREVTDSSGFTFGNTWLPRVRDAQGRPTRERYRMYTGLGISLNCGALLEGNITFHSAGASFVDQQFA